MQNFEMSCKVVVSARRDFPHPGSFVRQSASFPPRVEGPAWGFKSNECLNNSATKTTYVCRDDRLLLIHSSNFIIGLLIFLCSLVVNVLVRLFCGPLARYTRCNCPPLLALLVTPLALGFS